MQNFRIVSNVLPVNDRSRRRKKYKGNRDDVTIDAIIVLFFMDTHSDGGDDEEAGDSCHLRSHCYVHSLVHRALPS